ncbi:MAG: DNA primase [Deltaproteobacteria bacterium]|nr:DNA primase [Deltaproteobacteria bacterium]
MPIAPAVIESIRERIDMVELVGQTVSLKRKGQTGSYMGLCPFHKEKTPSFSVTPHKKIFHCFGCGEGGDCFRFIMKTRGLNFPAAVQELAGMVGIEIEQRELTQEEGRQRRERADAYEICSEAAHYYHSMLLTTAEGKPALDYLKGRGFTEETIKAFRLGFAPARWNGVLQHLQKKGYSVSHADKAGLIRFKGDHAYDLFRGRVMVPILDGSGKVVAFGGRVLESLVGTSDAVPKDPPKYVNSSETEIYKKSKVLYGLSQALSAVRNNDRMLIVEGYFDVIALHQAGFAEAVATCGTALTDGHCRLIRPLTRKVVALFDSDEAGLRASEKSLPMFIEAGIGARRLNLGEAKDPDEFIMKNGSSAFEDVLLNSEPLFELALRRKQEKNGASPEGKQKTVEELMPIVRLYDSAARHAVVTRMASALGLSESVIQDGIGRGRRSVEPTVPSGANGAVGKIWRGNKALNHLFWLLIHHHEMVVPEILEQSPEPEVISDYGPAKHAFALLLKGRAVTEVTDLVQEPGVRAVLVAAASRVGQITSDKAAFAARQNLCTLEKEYVDRELVSIDNKIRACNISDDESSYLSLVKIRAALQKRKDEIRTRFVR